LVQTLEKNRQNKEILKIFFFDSDASDAERAPVESVESAKMSTKLPACGISENALQLQL
jgi:hypothetical protein